MRQTEREKALSLLDDARREPDRVYVVAISASAAATKCGDEVTASIAERAAGFAARERGELDLAILHLRRSISFAEAAADDESAAISQSSLAFCLGQTGELNEGLRLVNEATPFLSGPALGLSLVHAGFLLFHLGERTEALDKLNHAHRLLVGMGDLDALAAALNNRGLVNWHVGNLGAAIDDLDEASVLYSGLGRGASAAKIRHNAGMVRVSAGRAFEGLNLMAQADTALDALGIDRSSGLLDRCRTLTRIGLFGEALELGRSMAPYLSRSNAVLELADLALLLAEAGVQHDDFVAAGAFAIQAARAFEFQGRFDRARSAQGIVRLVDLALGLAVDQRLPDVSAVDATCVVHVARRLLERGADETALGLTYQAQSTMADMPAGSTRKLTTCFAAAIVGTVLGDRDAVERAIDAAETRFANARLDTWPVELRALGLRRLDELCALAVRAAVRRGDMRAAVSYLERARRLRIAPSSAPNAARRQPDEALNALRSLSRGTQATDPAIQVDVREQRNVLERRIRQDDWSDVPAWLREPGSGWSTHPAVSARGRRRRDEFIANRWQDRAFVTFAETGSELHAFVVNDPGDPSTTPITHVALRPLIEVRRLIDDLRVHLAFWAASRAPKDRARSRIRALADALAAAGFAAVAEAAGDRDIVVSPTPSLTAVPWPLLPGWNGRAISVAASMSSWRPFAWRAPQNAVVVVGPGTTHGPAEAIAVSQILGSPKIFEDEEASSLGLRPLVQTADLLHVCAHGTFRWDHPLLSSVRLSDGELTLYDLAQSRLPAFMVMSACDFGSGSATAGSGTLGLISALSGLGCERLLASFCPVAESEVTELMRRFYGILRNGPSGADVATALAAAQRSMIADDALSIAGFQMLGVHPGNDAAGS
jgi:tetratricopeptide (TPR) repeat protein